MRSLGRLRPARGRAAGRSRARLLAHPCKEKDKACSQAVVNALRALTGVEKQRFDAVARLRAGMYAATLRDDNPSQPEYQLNTDPSQAEQAARLDKQGKK
ncbi:MAG: hypothetical protein JWO72_1224 [Caulobacteraceae bacterium]|nr:hypothetical protein [Caulobacteraceae bacterium]